MQKVRLGNLAEFVRTVLARLPQKEGAVVLALSGELGAGKTTFTQALAKELGVKDIVQSPTYVLMKQYAISYGTFRKLIHIDAYRLERPEEFSALKPDTFLDKAENLVVVEWPEQLGSLIAPDVVVRFSADPPGEAGGVSPDERYIELTHG
jgi:tRNA threonylcarbamoyladenosine biosynthesis protein TsaE